MNDTEYDRLSEIYNKYGSLDIFNYESKGRHEFKLAKGNVEIRNILSSHTKSITYISEESKKLEKNTFGYYELKFDTSKMIMKGSDQSYALESASYSTFVFGLNQDKLGLEIIERCRRNETCYEELLQEDFLKMQQIKLIYDDTGKSEVERDHSLAQFEEIWKYRKNILMIQTHFIILGLREKCRLPTTGQFDKTCLFNNQYQAKWTF
jgi:hypothetical protein